MATISLQPILPSPSIPRDILEEVIGCPVLTYLIEDGTKPGDNFMSVIYTVTAQVIPEGLTTKQETRHYFFKCYPRHPARQAYLNKTNFFHNELSFYSIWVKALTDFQREVLDIPAENMVIPAFPPYVGGKAIDYSKFENLDEANSKVYKPIDNFIVLIDLRRASGYQMPDRTIGMKFDQIRLTVCELAKIHALSWAYRQKVEWDLLKKFPFLKCRFDDEDMILWEKIVQQNVEIAVKTMDTVLGPGNHLSQSASRLMGKILKLVELFLDPKEDAARECWSLHRAPPPEMVKASEDEKPWRVICHGDSWCNNLLFKHDETTDKSECVTLIDFQMAREGCPTIDLAYLLYTSVPMDFRRQHLQDTLQIYHDNFNEICDILKVETLPDFTMEELRRRFHRSKLIGYMLGVTGLPNMVRESDKGTNLESVCESSTLDDMMGEAFGKGASESSLYRTRIVQLSQELYDEGVI